MFPNNSVCPKPVSKHHKNPSLVLLDLLFKEKVWAEKHSLQGTKRKPC